MRRSRVSLITRPSPLKLPNIHASHKYIPEIKQQPKLTLTKNACKQYKPKMKRILFQCFQSPSKLENNQLLVESCLSKMTFMQLKQQAIQKRVLSNLSQHVCQGTQKSRILIGNQAPFHYYSQYKKLTKNIQKQSSLKQNQPHSPYLPILEKSRQSNILPMCVGIIKFKGDSTVVNLNDYNLGDKYISAMALGLKSAKLVEKCYLAGNRISNKGFKQLVKNLSQQISILDLSNNKITKVQPKLLQLIVGIQARLQNLNFQCNLIRDKQTISSLLVSVTMSKHLKSLNLRGNAIGLSCADAICDLLDAQTVLEEFYIGKNFISSVGGQKIFNMLSKNKTVKVFDFSFNNLGQESNFICSKSISACLSKNKILLHVDLSHNNFLKQSSSIIAEGLQPNKKIIGFHFNGNYGYIDSRGFLIMEEKNLTTLHQLVQTKINAYDLCFRRKTADAAPALFKNVCWICQGWYQQEFKFVVPDSFLDQKKFVYIHFDFELFAPRLINLAQKHVKYTTMVPPKKYRYFFTFDHTQVLDKHTKSTKLQFPQSFSYQMYHQECTFSVQQTSERKGKAKKIVNDWNQLIISTLPRTNVVSKKQKQPWTYQKSMWAKQWKLDNQDLMKKCFQKDWKCTKLMNLVKNQQDQDKLKQLLSTNYKAIKLVYRYFASWSPFGDIWAVSNNSWTQFCQQAKIISKDTPLKITDLTFITTNSMSGADWKGNQLVPQRGLVRFQFMQAIVRMAQEKFKKNGFTDNFTNSAQLILKDHVLPLAASLQHEKWRTQKYFVQGNDNLVKKYRPIFTYVYKKNSKIKVKPGEKPFMCLGEFRAIIQKANLASSSIIQRDIFLSFNCSMMTQLDQLQNEKFIKMTQIQFIQALARCAQVLPQQYSLSQQKKNTELHHRFEWLINQLKMTQCNEDIKNQFPDQGSIFDQRQDQD